MMNRKAPYIITCLIFFFSSYFFGQELKKNSVKLSGYEKRWALLHPMAAIKTKRISNRCYVIYNQTVLDGHANGGRLDAFRHIFFMAALAQKVSVKKLRKLGFAHEKANYRHFLKTEFENGELPDSLSSIMDLQNNELGFRLGLENKEIDLNELAMKAKLEIQVGKAVIIKRNLSGLYLDCNDRPISLNNYLKIWNIPKCLAPSDYNYHD